MKNDGYYLGLDMGTNSVGWAITDKKYKVIKKNGKSLWGIRLFDAANTAEERRGFRTARRRTQRAKDRIDLLQEIFASPVNDIDPGFFQRLNESKYYPDEKRNLDGTKAELPYSLFVEKNFNDKDYHKKYPTIYHLRSELIHNKDPHDVRLVYLACHHIIKHRGHFLFGESSFDTVGDFKEAWKVFDRAIENEGPVGSDGNNIMHLDVGEADITNIENIMKDPRLTKTDKGKQLSDAIHAESKTQKTIAKLLAGQSIQLSDLFDDENYKEDEHNKIQYSASNYDDSIADIQEMLSERYVVIEAGKAIYDWSVLVNMLKGHKNYSDSKIKIFDDHKNDLLQLKKILKGNKELYEKVFGVPKDEKTCNYSSYIGMAKKNGRKLPIKNCTREDFYKFIRKEVLPDIDETYSKEISDKIDRDYYLPKQVIKDNAVVPYQIHLKELNEILTNAEGYLPFLDGKDVDGISNEEKIISILTFRIPFYVGPLNTYHKDDKEHGHSWAERKAEGKVYPWNFDKKIDSEKSAERFIMKMTNKCSYLIGEDVLPKYSILYSKFMVLNEINNIKIDGSPISVEQKQGIYNDLFLKKRRVTYKSIKGYLLQNVPGMSESDEVSGVDENVKSSMTSYIDFKGILTDSGLSENEMDDIVSDITLFGSDEHLLSKRLKIKYPAFSDKQIKKLNGLKYSGWGRLSKKFLCGITAPNLENGEMLSIIQMMWETNDNLMQILSGKYLFTSEINELNSSKEDNKKITYDTLNDMYLSPSVKRPVWQTIKIVRELKKIMGCDPDRVFVEVAREKGEKKRTKSRKTKLIELYNACDKDIKEEWVGKIENIDEAKFRSDKLYLYCTQLGRCPYCGEAIDIDGIWGKNSEYDIDHIYPQSKIMDDSLDNRVLAHKKCNENKTDRYPVDQLIRKRQSANWNIWKEKGLISQIKYDRLVRSTPFSEEELAGFIARQLVETRQSTKAIAELLKKLFSNSDIVYSKAAVVSQFRQDFDIIKVREVNDLHHAKDAYLNIVCGNTYFTKFSKDPLNYIKHDSVRTYNISKMFNDNEDHNKKPVERNGEVAWIYNGDKSTIIDVKKQMYKNDILCTRMTHENSNGGLFKQQILKKENGQVPIKSSDDRLSNIAKYGGYDKATGAYFSLIEYTDEKGKRKKSIESILQYELPKCDTKEKLISYFESKGYKDVAVLKEKILFNTQLLYNGFMVLLVARTGRQLILNNSVQLIIPYYKQLLIKKIGKYIDDKKNKINVKPEYYEIDESKLTDLYDMFADKLENTIFKLRPNNQFEIIKNGKQQFVELSFDEKCSVLSQLLHLFSCKSNKSDLSLIGGSKNAGIMLVSKQVGANIKLIHQSITGFFTQSYDLDEL